MEAQSSAKLKSRTLWVPRFSSITPALFLDRDGVIIEDQHYTKDPHLVRLCAGVVDLITSANSLGYAVVVVTNQSGIARGLLTWEQVDCVNQRMLELLGSGAQLAALYANGYGPDASATTWRKPSPGMLQDAAQQLNLDLKRSVMIGDRLSDIQAGVSAGVALVCHVLSGHGRAERAAVQDWHQKQQVSAAETLSRLLLADGLQGLSVNQLFKQKPC